MDDPPLSVIGPCCHACGEPKTHLVRRSLRYHRGTTTVCPDCLRTMLGRDEVEALPGDTTAIEAAVACHARQFHRSYNQGMGGPDEGDHWLNESARALVRAYCDTYGSATIGLVNSHGEAQPVRTITPEEATALRNFAADFVAPPYAARELERAVKLPGVSHNTRVQHIHQLVMVMKGQLLAWS